MRSSLRPKPSEVVKETVRASRSRSPMGATGVATAPEAGVAYASTAVKSPASTSSSASDHIPDASLPTQQRARHSLDGPLAVAHRGVSGREDGDRERLAWPLQERGLVVEALGRQLTGLEEHLEARSRDGRDAPALRRLDARQER